MERKTLARRALEAPFVVLAAIVVLFEDWLWDDLARLAAALFRLPVLRRVERLVARLPPYAALLLFGAPSLLLVPLKLAAVYFISRGQARLGVLTIIVAKVAGTALIARIFAVTRPALLRIGWFAALHARVVAFKERVHAAIESTAVWRVIHAQRLRLAAALRARRRGKRG